MYRASKSLLNSLPEGREDAVSVILEATREMWNAQWDPGGNFHEFGRAVWRAGIEKGIRLTLQDLLDRGEIVKPPEIPNPRESKDWDATFREYYRTEVKAPMSEKKLAEFIEYSYDHVRHMKGEYDAEHGSGPERNTQ